MLNPFRAPDHAHANDWETYANVGKYKCENAAVIRCCVGDGGKNHRGASTERRITILENFDVL